MGFVQAHSPLECRWNLLRNSTSVIMARSSYIEEPTTRINKGAANNYW
jgi:hypothetical protein